MEKHVVEIRFSDCPDILFTLRRELANLLRDEAEDEMDPRLARRLRDLAARFEAGVDIE